MEARTSVYVALAAAAIPLHPLNSSQGLKLLYAAEANAAFEQALPHLVTQEDLASCSRASATVVLNALAPFGVDAPVAPEYAPSAYWTQDGFVASACVASHCTKPCTLAQAAGALSCVSGVTATPHHADSLDGPAALEALIRATVSVPGQQLIANFNGAAMNMTHFGHFSPVVALSAGQALQRHHCRR